jgi:hypothetical protein
MMFGIALPGIIAAENIIRAKNRKEKESAEISLCALFL